MRSQCSISGTLGASQKFPFPCDRQLLHLNKNKKGKYFSKLFISHLSAVSMCVIPFSESKSQFLGACEVRSRDKWDIRLHSNTRPHCSNLLSASWVTWQKQLSAWSPAVKSGTHLNCSTFSVFLLSLCNTYMTTLVAGRPLCGHLG